MAACAIAVSSCADTAPEIPQDELYLRGFIKQFGMPDADHTWSMATAVEADVRLDSRINGMATFYTTAPESPDCKVLGSTEIVDGRGSQRFDVRCGTGMVYVRVANSKGMTEFSGFVASTDGHIAVTTSASRADGDCPIGKEPMEWTYMRMPEKELNAAVRFIKENPDYEEKTWSDIINASSAYGQENQIYSTDKVSMPVQNIYKLTGRPERTWTAPFPWSEIQAIIDNYFVGEDAKPAVFSESYNNKFKDNIRKFYQQPEDEAHKLDAHNSTIVEEDGPVTLELMWRGAHQQNYIFGYYYYTQADYDKMLEDPAGFFDKVPKFLIYDASDPEYHVAGDNSIFQVKRCELNEKHYRVHDLGTEKQQIYDLENDPCHQSGEHKLQDNWVNLIGNVCNAVKDQQHFMRGSILRGEVIKLAYFGKDGKDDTATYDFDKGTRIGFFGAKVGTAGTFFCSDAVLGFYLFNRTYTQEGFDKNKEAVPGHYPKVARFHVAGSDYMGVELEEDNDLNDLVFRIRNVEPAPDITPKDFPKEADPEEWIIACEDMGSYNDYDFNDVVLKVGVIPKKEEGDKIQIKITPIACGGTLDSYVSFRTRQFTEIHTWLNREKGIAAGAGPNTPKIEHSSVKPEYITIDDNEYLLSEKYAVDFSVSTTWRNGEKIESLWYERVEADEFQRMQGKAPQMLLLDPKWSWPVENRYIIEAYPEFKDWIHDIKNYNWINNTPNPSYIHVRID